MKEIIDLNKWLLDYPADLFLEEDLMLSASDPIDELSGFPQECREKIQCLRAEIEKRIPAGFTYGMGLGLGSPCLYLTYGKDWEDPKFCGHAWDENRSILEQLEEMDWSVALADAMAQSRTAERQQMWQETMRSIADAPPRRSAVKV